jgi:DNA-binding NtrC family response regulator
MAPIEAKVFFVDDERSHHELGRVYLEQAGHQIVETARTVEEAMAKIPT